MNPNDRCEDGVRLGDVMDAIKAAWPVDEAFADQLAERYNLADYCRRCMGNFIDTDSASIRTAGPRAERKARLCTPCYWQEWQERK